MDLRALAIESGFGTDYHTPYGDWAIKLRADGVPRVTGAQGKLVLVSAMSPSPTGEGKTTTTIGLTDALRLRGERAIAALREPSMGPVFGAKGGGTGGGKATIEPAQRINLHFTGDFHALTAAHNLIAAVVDNHLHFRSELGLLAKRVVWPRVLDVNDRALRNIAIGMGGTGDGAMRQASFEITAASELMAILALAKDSDDLAARLARIVVGYRGDGSAVRLAELAMTPALLALLEDALQPNFVRTQGGSPALVHAGPFANIAHGASSIRATRLGLATHDWVVTECGFGFDLGGEKFMHIVAAAGGFAPSAVVLVATIKALRYHGGIAAGDMLVPNAAAVARGLANLTKHIENARLLGVAPIVAINSFASDAADELALVRAHCEALGVALAVCTHFGDGAPGALALADAVIAAASTGEPASVKRLFAPEAAVTAQLTHIATQLYGASGVDYAAQAQADLAAIARAKGDDPALAVCVAKTQYSFADDAKRVGGPSAQPLHVARVQWAAGAGFAVAVCGDISRMPGLPRAPQGLAGL